MANTMIEVAVIASSTAPGSPTHCAIVIANCDAMHADTKRQMVNGPVPAYFTEVPTGRYYIIVVPEGGNARHVRFLVIDGTLDVTSITFDISAADTSGRITAIVLVGGQRAANKTVMIKGKADGYTEYCMTDPYGVAEFRALPETQAYDVIAYNGSASLVDTCDLVACGDCDKNFSFPVEA